MDRADWLKLKIEEQKKISPPQQFLQGMGNLPWMPWMSQAVSGMQAGVQKAGQAISNLPLGPFGSKLGGISGASIGQMASPVLWSPEVFRRMSDEEKARLLAEMGTSVSTPQNPFQIAQAMGQSTRPGGVLGTQYEEKIPFGARLATEIGLDVATWTSVGKGLGATKFARLPKPARAVLGVEKPRPTQAQVQKYLPTAKTLLGKPIQFKDTAVGNKLHSIIKLHREARAATTTEQAVGRGSKTRVLAEAQKTISAKEAFESGRAAKAGQLGRVLPEIPENLKLSANDLDELFKIAKQRGASPWEIDNLLNALMKDVPNDVLQPNQIKLLNRVFFPGEQGLAAKVWGNVLDVANAPRATLASVDHSAVARQGIFETLYQGFRHPIRTIKSIGNGLKMLVAPGKGAHRSYTYLDTLMRRDPSFAAATSKGMYFAPNTDDIAIALTRHEEMFMSNIARKVPWIKRSEDAYTYFLNRVRLDAFKDVADDLARLGAKDTDYRLFAKIVNASTGRGDISVINKILTGGRGDVGPALNATFFSPRLLVSRFQMPYYSLKAIFRGMAHPNDPAARLVMKEAAGRLAAMASVVGTTLGLVKASGLAEVETDFRSADFLKARIGNTRIDPWAGYQQIFRFLYQLGVGEQKSSTTGRVSQVDQRELIWKFLQSKASPSIGILLDLLEGETYYGEEIKTPQWVREKTVPLFLQDLWDAFEDKGLMGMGLATPGFMGVGVQTYETRTSGKTRWENRLGGEPSKTNRWSDRLR
jgi:hypothetical protein